MFNKLEIIVIFKYIRFFIVPLFISLFIQNCTQQSKSLSLMQKIDSPIEAMKKDASFNTPIKSIKFSYANSKYIPTIKKYAKIYDIDWVLVLAVIEQESRFNHSAVSHKGAYGLMQIMPLTQIELEEKLGVCETTSPHNNIKAGIYHLRSLYKMFDKLDRENRIAITLAAYNAGIGRILDAQKICVYLDNDQNKWSSVKDALRLLSQKYYTLHRCVWDEGVPPSGYLKNYTETCNYVDTILNSYDEYTLAFK